MEDIPYELFIDINIYFTQIVDLASLNRTNKQYNTWVTQLWNNQLYRSKSINKLESSSGLVFEDDTANFLKEACRRNHTPLVNILLQHYWPRIGASADNNWAIRHASYHGYTELAKLLLRDHRVYAWDNDNEAILAACQQGHTKIVKLLLNGHHITPNVLDNAPIRRAAENGHIDVVRILLADPRVNPADFNNQAIKTASLKGHTEVVKLLLADPKVTGIDFDNLRDMAIQGGHADIVDIYNDYQSKSSQRPCTIF